MSVVPWHTHSFSGTTGTTDTNHTHGYSAPNTANVGYAAGGSIYGAQFSATTGGMNSNQSHNHTISGSVAANDGSANWTPRYLDMVIGVKN
jgi:hypothetical protein